MASGQGNIGTAFFIKQVNMLRAEKEIEDFVHLLFHCSFEFNNNFVVAAFKIKIGFAAQGFCYVNPRWQAFFANHNIIGANAEQYLLTQVLGQPLLRQLLVMLCQPDIGVG